MIDEILLDEFVDQEVGKLYTKLRSLHQFEFPTDYQLKVVYTKDVVNNPDYPGEYLNHLVRILSEIDIPTFFVCVETNCKNIARDLDHLNSIYNNGIVKHKILNGIFDAIEVKKDTFCILPWMHFYFNPQGQVTPCCQANTNYPLSNYKTNKIDFNSAKIVKFRETLLNGLEAPQCSSCYIKEQNQVVSPRQTSNQKFYSYRPKEPTANVDDFKLRYVDVRLSNVCNLKCRMCSGKFSSRIADEDYKIWGATEFIRTSNSTQEEDKILDILLDQIDNIEHLYFAGGEPLISETHYKILDLMLLHNKRNINISYNTNFSILNYKKHNVLDYWKKFKNVKLGASIDLIGPAADYVRNGVDYQTLEDNYQALKANCPDVKFTITSVLSLYNIFNLCKLQRHWIDNIGLSPTDLTFVNLVSPDHLSSRVLPKHVKQDAERTITSHIRYLESINAISLAKQWGAALTYMNSQDHSYLLTKFFELGDIRDQHRKQSFESYFPEFSDLRASLVL